MPVLTITKSQQKEKALQSYSTDKRHKWKLNDTDPHQPEKLFQDPDDINDECLYTKYFGIPLYSPTNSRESRTNYAWKELMILLRKEQIPTIEAIVNFLGQFPMKRDIDEFRESIRRCFKYRNIDAIIAIGLTKGKDGKPNNTVHLHYLMGNQEKEERLLSEEERQRRKETRELIESLRSEKDKQRRKETISKFVESLQTEEMQQRLNNINGIIKKVCERYGFVLMKDYKIASRPLWNGEKYFAYFVKYGKYGKDIPLFIEGLNMQEITQTGWFENGEKERLWDEFLQEKYGDDYSRGTKKGQKPKSMERTKNKK